MDKTQYSVTVKHDNRRRNGPVTTTRLYWAMSQEQAEQQARMDFRWVYEIVSINPANTACTPTNGGLAQAESSSTPAAVRG